MLLVLCASDEHLLRNLRIELRLARPKHVVDSGQRVRIWRISLAELVCPANLVRVDMRDGELLGLPVFTDNVDRSPIGEIRYYQFCELGERSLVIERSGECLRCTS